MKTAESGMNSSEYIRFLIEKDNDGRYKRQSSDELTSWQESRAAITISDTQIALLEAIKKEYENKKIVNKSENFKKFCEKYSFNEKIANADLKILVKKYILTENQEKNVVYGWTNEGIFILPEYAFSSPNDCPFMKGDVAGIMQEMFGDYWETVQFIQDSLKISKKKSNDVFKIILGEHILFIKFLRDHLFDMTGIAEPNDVIYYRKQMMVFLMTYCLNVRDPDLIDTSNEFRKLCDDLVNKLANYFKNQKEVIFSNNQKEQF
jgi:hypothetical protein